MLRPRDAAMRRLLRDLASVTGDDFDDIMSRLAPDQRQAVEAFIAAQQTPRAPKLQPDQDAAAAINLPGLSPWLAARMTSRRGPIAPRKRLRLARGAAPIVVEPFTITEAAHQALAKIGRDLQSAAGLTEELDPMGRLRRLQRTLFGVRAS